MKVAVAVIDRLNRAIGYALGWLTLAMVLLTSAVVLLRYHYGQGSIALQEAVLWTHGLVLMLGAAYTLQTGHHVRVDVFYSRFSPRAKAWVNIVGSALLLLPLCGWLFWLSTSYAAASWQVGEASKDAGGLPALYLLKTAIPVAFALLALQGIAELLRNVLRLRGQLPWPLPATNKPPVQATKSPDSERLKKSVP